MDGIDRFGTSFKHDYLFLFNCELIDKDNFIFRGRFPNILDILDKEKIPDSNNTKIEGYKYVYFPNNLYYEYADLFPNYTTFVISDPYFLIKKKNNCHFVLTSTLHYERNSKYDKNIIPYYLAINRKSQYEVSYRYIGFDIGLCYVIPFFIILFCIYYCKLFWFIFFMKLQFYVYTRRLILLSIPLIISNLLMKYILPFSLVYSFFKSYILINLIFLLDGNSILEFGNIKALFKKYLLICFAIDGTLNLLIDYIIYFIPSINNLYYDAIKNLVEHIALLIYTFKSYETKYLSFEKQFLYEIRLKSILSLFYVFKIAIYKKVIKFAFLYSCVFVGFQIYKIIFLYDYVDAFFFNYFINTGLELFFVLILVKMFYPENLTIFYFIPVRYDYNSKIYNVQITKEENKLKISNLNENILENEIKKNNIPLVFINPFSKSDEVFDNAHIGEIVKI